MSTSAPARGESASSAQPVSQPAAPPWLWLWLVLFLTGLGGYWSEWRSTLEQFRQAAQSNQAMAAAGMRAAWLDTLLLVPPFILDLLPTLGMLATVAVAFFPQLRARYLERRFRLRPPTTPVPALTEIQQFVAQQDPSLTLTTNLARVNQLAFVYPTSYRRANLAVFGGLLKLWHTDRAAGEAVLLHEIAHHRRGDVLIVGVGSLFQWLIKYLPLAWLLLYILPVLGMDLVQAWRSAAESHALNVEFDQVRQLTGSEVTPVSHSLQHSLVNFFKITLPGIFFVCVGGLAGHINRIVAPVLALWVAELTADRLASERQGTPEHVGRALALMRPEQSRWKRWLFCTYHPPMRLRRWLLNRPGRIGLLLLLLIYPLAAVIKLILFHFYANGAYLASLDFARVSRNFLPNSLAVISYWPVSLTAIGLLLLVWPWVFGRWEKVFAGAKTTLSRRDVPVHLSLAALLLLVALASWLGTRHP